MPNDFKARGPGTDTSWQGGDPLLTSNPRPTRCICCGPGLVQDDVLDFGGMFLASMEVGEPSEVLGCPRKSRGWPTSGQMTIQGSVPQVSVPDPLALKEEDQAVIYELRVGLDFG